MSIAGEILDVFLRITAEKMLEVFGEKFTKLLKCFQEQLLPLLPENAIGTQRLKSFLSEAIQSKGRSFPSIYEET